jgi:hypothetical protein
LKKYYLDLIDSLEEVKKMNVVKKVLHRAVIFLKELVNIITDVLVPIMALIAAILELIPFVPLKWAQGVKKLEDFFYNVAGTAKDIKEEIKKIK